MKDNKKAIKINTKALLKIETKYLDSSLEKELILDGLIANEQICPIKNWINNRQIKALNFDSSTQPITKSFDLYF